MLFLESIYNCVERFQYKLEIHQKARFNLIESIITRFLDQRCVQEDIAYGEIVPIITYLSSFLLRKMLISFSFIIRMLFLHDFYTEV